MFKRIERYEDHGLGLPYPVILLNAAEEEVDVNGARIGVRIPNLEGLAAAVAVGRCLVPADLGGLEVRFLRRVLGLTQKELASRLEMRHETLSRWESRKEEDSNRPVGEWADKALRMLVTLELHSKVPGISMDLKSVTEQKIRVRAPNEWPKLTAELVAVKADGHRTIAWDTTPQFQAA